MKASFPASAFCCVSTLTRQSNRIQKSLPTINDLLDKGARLAIIAHQGDTSDYGSLVGLQEHAERLSDALGKPVQFIEDIAGPAAVEKILALDDGEALLLDNIRYLTEEVSTFEDSVKQEPADMSSLLPCASSCTNF
jgi:phosphoglycerate kinase